MFKSAAVGDGTVGFTVPTQAQYANIRKRGCWAGVSVGGCFKNRSCRGLFELARAIGSLWSDSGCCADKRMVQEGLANGYQVR